jgi:probable phosphoglycerate mutase
MKKIYLVTHAEAAHSAEDRVGGWYDSPLTHRGKKAAGELGDKLASYGAELGSLAVYSSDLLRCKQTTELIMASNGGAIKYDPRLREMSFGDNEGIGQLEHNKIMQPRCPEGNRMDHRICSGSESRRELAERVKSFVDEIMEQEGDALVVTHGFAATFVVTAFQNISVEEMGFVSYRFSPGSISILVEDDFFKNRTLSTLNA